MDELSVKSATTSRGMEYKYWISKATPDSPKHPPLFLLHGFRGFAISWKYTLPYLKGLPNRLVIPDLLGHGGTSKPKDTAVYAYHLMVQDMLDIANFEGYDKVIPVGHDHGAGLAQRMYNHAPDRIEALILLNVAYSPPSKGQPFNLAAMNAYAKEAFGYPAPIYWNFLTAPDAAGLMNANLDRVWEIPHANSFEEMRDLYGVANAMRNYLSDRSIPSVNIKPYARDPKLFAEWKQEIERGGLEGPLCWYTAHVQQVQCESDKLVADEHMKVNVPSLFIGCDADAPCRVEAIEGPKNAGLLPDLTVEVLHGVGHWPAYEKPQETADMIVRFLQAKL